MATKRYECLFMIITIWDNKIESWSLVIANAIYNYFLSLPDAHFIHWQFAYTNQIKKFIIFQTHIRASSKQIITII